MKTTRLTVATLAAATTILVSSASAQLATQDLSQGATVSDLINSIVGPGVTVSNVVYNGTAQAAGLFTGGTAAVGFENGVILSTGNIAMVKTNAQGQNVSTSTGIDNLQPGDPQLQAIVNATTFNRCVLEFDFECENLQVISFQYVFSSEEYNEYANTTFNDVFAFFVNGVNRALLPDDVTPVSINNVNGGRPLGTNPQNPAFYVNNSCNNGSTTGQTGFPCFPPNRPTEMDGLTVVLNLTATVNPGVNHIKLAIADVSDGVWDSVVFIRAQSFTCTPPETTGACCFADGSCMDLIPGDCADAGGTFNPDTNCDTFSCAQPTGACCLSNGTCVDVTAAECADLNGAFNADVDCAGANCPPPPDGCTYTQGYWKNHPEAWPVDSLALGNHSYTKAQLLLILKTPVKGNGLISLAHQLIAAKLNVANGAGEPPAASVAIAAADALIGKLMVPPVGNGFVRTSETSALTALLDMYNNGVLPGGPPHCD